MQLNAGQTVQCMSAKPSPLTRLQAAIRVAGRLSSLHSLLAASIPLKLWVTYESLCQEAKGVLRGVDEVRMMEHPPMPQAATIKSLPAAFRMMKAMQAGDVEWGEDYRASARHALAELLEGRMGQLIDEHLERMAEVDQADRRNGYYARWLLTELGMIELHVPRTRTFSALKVVRAYARRAKDVDRMILACFVLGLSTRKVAAALLPVLGRPVSLLTLPVRNLATFRRRPRALPLPHPGLDRASSRRTECAGSRRTAG